MTDRQDTGMKQTETNAAKQLNNLRDHFAAASSQASDDKHDAEQETREWYYEGKRDAFQAAEEVVYDIVQNLDIDDSDAEGKR